MGDPRKRWESLEDEMNEFNDILYTAYMKLDDVERASLKVFIDYLLDESASSINNEELVTKVGHYKIIKAGNGKWTYTFKDTNCSAWMISSQRFDTRHDVIKRFEIIKEADSSDLQREWST